MVIWGFPKLKSPRSSIKEIARMKELEIIIEYIEEGKNQKKVEELLHSDHWSVEKEKLEKLLDLLKNYRSHDEKCPDFEEAVRFYYGEIPPNKRETFTRHLAHCRGLCVETLMSLKETENKTEFLLGELRDRGLVSGELLAYITQGSGLSSPNSPMPIPESQEGSTADRIRAYEFFQRYGSAVVALSVARAVRGRVLKAGGEGIRSVIKESDDFRVEVYPSPEAPGRLEAEISLKSGVEKDGYEGVEVLVFLQAQEATLSGIGVIKDGTASELALGGGRVKSGVFDDPERIKVEIYMSGETS